MSSSNDPRPEPAPGTRSDVRLDPERRSRWEAKKAHYQDEAVVESYDEERFRTAHERASTDKKWRAIQAAVGQRLPPGARVLDVPCGRGRFTRRILDAGYELVSADLSWPMLQAARATTERESGAERSGRWLRCDAERLPFADDTFDLVLSIRFLFHVPPELRASILREMARVSKRHVIVDVRHTYCLTTHGKRLRAWLTGRRPPSPRSTLAQIDRDLAVAGLVLERRVWLAPLLSEKMLVVATKR